MNMDESRDRAPSRLELARYATDELSVEERESLEARMTDASRAYLAELEEVQLAMPPLDLEAVRARATKLESSQGLL